MIASGGTVLVDRAMVLKATAWKTGMTESPVRRGDYVITGIVGAGDSHSLAVKADGSLYTFGYNAYGQLGDGSTTQRLTPVAISGISGVVGVAGGLYHSLALKSDGTVWASGGNSNGQLGNGTTTQSNVFVQATGGLSGAVAVAAGQYHSLALTSDGRVFAWGSNSQGQLGDGSYTNRTSPVEVGGLTGVVAIAAGDSHSLVLKGDGSLVAWGANTLGQLGDGTTTNRNLPVAVGAPSGIVAIAAGNYHSLALKTDGAAAGTAWVWGRGTSGELGDGAYTPSRTTPGQVSRPTAVTGILGRGHFNLDWQPDGRGGLAVWGWGQNAYGQLADATNTLRLSPVRTVATPDLVRAAAGEDFVLVVKRDGTLAAWGWNDNGQLGDNTQTSRNTPAAVPGLTLASNSWLTADSDLDGLTNGAEWFLGTDPLNQDTNGDGIPDGLAVQTGTSPTSFDLDGDGLLNATEIQLGTNPHVADTDGDTYLDGVDCFPIDPTRWQCPAPTPGDTTPPVITLTEPTNATLISSVPPQ